METKSIKMSQFIKWQTKQKKIDRKSARGWDGKGPQLSYCTVEALATTYAHIRHSIESILASIQDCAFSGFIYVIYFALIQHFRQLQ